MREAQGASGIRGSFLLDTFLWTSKEKYLVRGYENPHSNNRRGSDTFNVHIPVSWIPASGASSYLLAALPPSLAVVHAGMTATYYMQVDSVHGSTKLATNGVNYQPFVLSLSKDLTISFNNLHPTHIPQQSVRNMYSSLLVLIVFHHRNQCPTSRQA